MGLFSKTEQIEALLPFRLVTPTLKDEKACVIDIEAYGCVGNCNHKYFYASVYINRLVYDEFVHALINFNNEIKIIAKVKNDVVKKFEIDFKDLAHMLQNDKFEKASIAGYGITDVSCFDR